MLTITERLRKHGVVGKFVEFFGPGLAHLTIADRATLGNMCPEYGATIAIFPIDEMTLDYLRLSGRDESRVRAGRSVRQGAGAVPHAQAIRIRCTRETIELDLATVEPSLAGPRRPQDRVSLKAGEERIPGQPACAAGGREEAGVRRLRRTAAAVAELPAVGVTGSWLGRHRGHHQLHEHVEPERDDRRGPASRRRPSNEG